MAVPSSLLLLPDELLSAISNQVDPSTLSAFASTCKRVFSCCQKALVVHAKHYDELHLLHDRNAMTVLDVLRDILANPHLAWYIRGLEWWQLRETFAHWHGPDFFDLVPDRGEHDGDYRDVPDVYRDYRYLADEGRESLYSDDELATIRSLLSSVLCLPEPDVEQWSKRLTLGSDEPLRALLMALSPKLSRVVFIAYDTWVSPSAISSHPLRLLGASLRHMHQSFSPGIAWPHFASLRSIVVGTRTTFRHPHRAYYPSPRAIAPLFLIPTIEELYLTLISATRRDDDNDPDTPYVYEWGQSTSSCAKLTFSSCDLPLETVESFIGACGALRAFECVAECPSKHKVVQKLADTAKSTLEVLKINVSRRDTDTNIGLQLSPRSGCRTSSAFDKLKTLEVQTHELLDPRTYVPCTISGYGVAKAGATYGHSDWLSLAEILGDSVKTIETVKVTGGQSFLFQESLVGLMAMLTSFLEAKATKRDRKTQSAYLGRLNTICLAAIGSWQPRMGNGTINLLPWCAELQRMCDRKSVYLHYIRFDRPDNKDACGTCRHGDSKPVLLTEPIRP